MDFVNTTNGISRIDLFLNEDEHAAISLGVMAAKIAFYNFQWRYITLVIFLSAPSSLGVDIFLSHYNKSVAVKLGKFQPLHHAFVPQYVLFGEESSDITEYLKWLIEMNYDNTGKYLLICYSTDFRQCNENNVFKVLANIHINNAIFLRIGDDNTSKLFTYQMIVPGTCKNSHPKRLDINTGCSNDKCYNRLYPENFNNLHKCPLVVSTFEQPPFMYLHNGTREPTGADADILKIVTSALNATLIIKTPTDGNDWGRYVDNNWTGSMGDVFNGRADISMCSLPLTSNKYGNFQVSSIYNTMDIVWVAKLPAVKPSWEKLLHPFNIRARISLLVIFIFVLILSGLIRTRGWAKIRKLLNIGNTKYSILFYSWAIFLGMPLVREPSKRALLIVLYCWIWFCFIIRSSYQAALINSLKKTAYQKKFQSFYDVLEQKHKYGGQGSYREYFVDEQKIYDNWEQLDFKNAHEKLNKISNGTSNFVLAFNKEMVIDHLLKRNGTKRLQIIPRKVINSPTVMYLKKYSPLRAPLNTVLSRAVEAGYAQAWRMQFKRQKKNILGHMKKRGIHALTLEHYSGCIMLTVVGWAVSIIFFLIEVYCGRMEEHNY